MQFTTGITNIVSKIRIRKSKQGRLPQSEATLESTKLARYFHPKKCECQLLYTLKKLRQQPHQKPSDL